MSKITSSVKNNEIEAELDTLLAGRTIEIKKVKGQCFSITAFLGWTNNGYHQARVMDVEVKPTLETSRERSLAKWIDWSDVDLMYFADYVVQRTAAFKKYTKEIAAFVTKCKRRKINLELLLQERNFFES